VPAVRKVHVESHWLAPSTYRGAVACRSRAIMCDCPVPIGQCYWAQQVLAFCVVGGATGYTGDVAPDWAQSLFQKIAALVEAVRQIEERRPGVWYEPKKWWIPDGVKERSVYSWLLEAIITQMQVFDLRGLVEQVGVESVLAEATATLVDLLHGKPRAVTFSDGTEREIRWEGNFGSVLVDTQDQLTNLEPDSLDPRVRDIAQAGHTLSLKRYCETREEVEGYSAGQSDEITWSGYVSRKIV
jgi:hypothetical protein